MSKQIKKLGNSVTKVVKGVVKAVGSIVTGVVKAVGKVVTSVISFVASPFGSLGIPDASSKTSEEQRQQGVLIQTQGSYTNLPVVYGYRKIAGTVVYVETGSEDNKYLWVAYALCEGTIEGLREVFIDDVQMPADTAGKLNAGQIVDITDTTNKYNGRVRLQFFPGVYHSNPASTQIGTLSILKDSPSWKNTMSYNGVAVVFARYEWKKIVTQTDADNNPFSGNVPQLQVSMLGRKVANLFQAGVENVAYGASGYTERYSINPAECLTDYLRNPRYGKGLTNSEIDWDSFKISANKCATQVQYILGTTGPILTLNHVVDTGQTIFSNVKTMLTHMRGYLPYVQGRYKLKIEDAGNDTSITSGSANIVAAFTNDGRTSTSWTTGTRNIMGEITYTGIDRSNKYNSVVISYVDPDQKWSVQQVAYPETESERLIYVQQDGGRENKGEFTFGGITNYAIAKDFAKLIFNKSRWQDTCSFVGDSSCFDLEPGDNIYIDSKILRFGLEPTASAIPWRIISIKLNNDYTFDIGCVRNPDFLYPHTSVGAIDTVLPTYLPRGASIIYPQNLRPGVGLNAPNSAPYTPVGSGSNTGGDGGGSTTTNPPTTVGTGGTLTAATATGSIAGTVLTITSMGSGGIQPGLFITGTGVLSNTRVVSQSTGVVGGVGTYVVDRSQTVSSTLLTFSLTANQTNTPTNPPNVPPLTNTVVFSRVSFQNENGSVFAILEFNQPNHVMYSGTLFYFRSTLDTFFKTYENNDVPGVGNKIFAKIGPLVNGTRIEVVARVKYSTGEFSNSITKTGFNANANDPASDPVEWTEVVTPGWSLPTNLPPNSRDTQVSSLVGATVLNGSVPFSPRRMTFTTRQNVISNGLSKFNYYIKGFNIYYKQSDQTVWRTAFYNFPSGYQEGNAVTFSTEQTTPIMNLGPAFNTTTPGTQPGRRQLFDFILRYSYTDGTESTFQLRKMEVRTEWNEFGLMSFDPFYTGYNTRELVSEYVNAYGFVTDRSAGPGFLPDPLNITVGINSIFARNAPPYGSSIGSTPSAVIFIDPPVASNMPDWAGIRLIKRKFGGTDVTTDYINIVRNESSLQYSIRTPIDVTGSSTQWTSATYEYVLIPLVYTATGGSTPQEANTAFYFAGTIGTQDPVLAENKNWLTTVNPVSSGTAAAKAKLGTVSQTIIREVNITSASAVPYAPGGVIQDPRVLDWTITQSATDSFTPSTITGVKMYYRPVGFQYWYYNRIALTLTPGTPVTFRTTSMTPAPDLGTPASPPFYDFIFRLTFSDGTESTREFFRGASANTGTGTSFGGTRANSTFLTVDQAPPGTFTDPRNYNFTLRSVNYSPNTTNLAFFINPITSSESYVSGVRLRYRPVTIGTNPAFLTWSDDTIRRNAVNETLFSIGQLLPNAEYEVVATPLVRFNNERIESTTSWYGRGILNRDIEMINAMQFQQMDTNVAVGRLTTTLEQAPGTETIVVINNGWQSQRASDGQAFAQLRFTKGHINNYFGVDIYRRAFFPATGQFEVTEYQGLGRWEKCATVTDATHAPDANGIVTVNLRAPVHHDEFDPYYLTTVYGATPHPFLLSTRPFNSLALQTFASNTTGYQYVCQVRTGGSGEVSNTRVTVLPLVTTAPTTGVQQYFTPLINSDTSGTFIRNFVEFTNFPVLRDIRVLNSEFTATISGTTMTVSAVASGAIQVGTLVRNATNTLKTQNGRPLPVFVTALGTGTGGTGTYTLGTSVTLGTATALSGSAGARTTLPNSNIIRSGQFASNAFNGSTIYTLPPTTPPCI